MPPPHLSLLTIEDRSRKNSAPSVQGGCRSMRVLFVSTYFPRDLHILVHGVFKRMGMFVDAIKEIAQLDVLFYVSPDIDVSAPAVSAFERSLSEHWNAEIRLFLCRGVERKRQVSKWRRYGASVFSSFRRGISTFTSGPEQMQAFEACLQRKPDAIFAHKLSGMSPVLLATNGNLPPIFFDLDDIEHIALLRDISQQTRLHSKVLSYLRVPGLLWGERRAMRLAHRTFVCSELDRHYLANRWHVPGIVTVPNAVAIPELQPLTPEPTLVFIGSYRHKPNVDAVEFLVGEVWPRVYRKMPAARLIIAGNPPDRLRGYNDGVPGVEFTGFVDDLGALYRRSRVVCAPIFVAAGTRVKIIEAAAYGRAIVATTIGAEGLHMGDGHEPHLRDDPESFAEACLSLLHDTVLCRRLGSAARAKAVELYDREKILRSIQRCLKDEDCRVPNPPRNAPGEFVCQ